MIKLLIIAIVLLSIAFVFLGFNIFFRKKKFPEYEVGHNKEMKKRGILCTKHEELKCWNKAKKGHACSLCSISET